MPDSTSPDRPFRAIRFSAAGTLALSAASGVSAQTVTHGTIVSNSNPGISTTGSSSTAGLLRFDITGDGTNDFLILAIAGTTGKHAQKAKGQLAPDTYNLNTVITGTALSSGAVVGPTSDFQLSSDGTEAGGGEFLSSGTSYYGFSLNNGSGDYGWIELSLNSSTVTSPTVSVLGWAYDDSGAPIDVGATMSAVPEPAFTSMGMGTAALLAGSLAAWRRRKTRILAAA